MLIAEYRVDSPLLTRALDCVPETTLCGEEAYFTASGEIRCQFWADSDRWDDFEAGLEADPTITDPRLLAEVEGRRLYRVALTDCGKSVTMIPRWGELDVVLLEATATREGWEKRMRIPDRETLARYRSGLRERGLGFRLQSLYRETDAKNTVEARLSDEQYAALATAYRAGYFDVPRRTSQSELAERLQISSQALSERLRRGTATLVRETIAESPS